MLIVNNNLNGYNEIRNIVSSRTIYKKDFFSHLNKIKHRISGMGYNPFFKGLFYSMFCKKPCHFYNTINLGTQDWIVTFETKLPRLGKVSKFWFDIGVKRLAKDNCKKIIAMSDCAYEVQLNFIKREYPQFYIAIRERITVLHPPQKLLINNYSEKGLAANSIIFSFVGDDFFRKGGREVLKVFARLIPKYPHIKLFIISGLKYNDYATHSTKSDYNEALKIILDFPQNIILHQKLENSKVLELLKGVHVGLLPTWGDSYGYSVLESQAAGCPVITTNLRALPEINNEEIGWIINLPLDSEKNLLINVKEDKNKIQELIEIELDRIITNIITFPNQIFKKGNLALKKIAQNHNYDTHRNELNKFYKDFE